MDSPGDQRSDDSSYIAVDGAIQTLLSNVSALADVGRADMQTGLLERFWHTIGLMETNLDSGCYSIKMAWCILKQGQMELLQLRRRHHQICIIRISRMMAKIAEDAERQIFEWSMPKNHDSHNTKIIEDAEQLCRNQKRLVKAVETFTKQRSKHAREMAVFQRDATSQDEENESSPSIEDMRKADRLLFDIIESLQSLDEEIEEARQMQIPEKIRSLGANLRVNPASTAIQAPAVGSSPGSSSSTQDQALPAHPALIDPTVENLG